MFRIIRVLFLYVLIAHWGGCLWYWLNKWESRNSSPGEVSWMVKELNKDDYVRETFGGPFNLLGCTETVLLSGHGVDQAREVPTFSNTTSLTQTCEVGHFLQYWVVMYAAMMLMLGDNIGPQTSVERAFAVILTLLGACLTAMMFGQMAQIVSGMAAENRKYDEFTQHVKDQMKNLKVMGETKARVTDYFEYQWRLNVGMDRDEFMRSLSPTLKTEILLSVYAEIVGKISFLKSSLKDHPDMICYLVGKLRSEFFLPSDIIIHEGELTTGASSMYFITRGHVAAYHASRPGKILHVMKHGDYFGEMAYMNIGSRRTSSICAISNSDIAMLNFCELDDCGEFFPRFRENLQFDMKKHIESLGETNELASQAESWPFTSTTAIKKRRETTLLQNEQVSRVSNINSSEAELGSIGLRASRKQREESLSEEKTGNDKSYGRLLESTNVSAKSVSLPKLEAIQSYDSFSMLQEDTAREGEHHNDSEFKRKHRNTQASSMATVSMTATDTEVTEENWNGSIDVNMLAKKLSELK